MQKVFFFIFIIFPTFFYAQIVKIYNNEYGTQIIKGHAISNSTKKQYYTNSHGDLLLKFSKPQEKFTFFAVGFQDKTLSRKELINEQNQVFLIPYKESLDEVVVSNTKWKQSKRQISKKITSINQNNISNSNPQTTADLVSKSGNIFVQKSQQGGGSPIIRGFSTNRILITVDGIRMNNAIFRSGNLQNIISIDPLALQSAEIISGPGSVIYGSDAIGGTLNFKTLTPKLRSKKNLKTVSGNLFHRASSANNEQTTHADVNLALKKWATTSSFSFSRFGDLVQGSNGPDDFLRNEYVRTENGVDLTIKNRNPKKQISSGYSQYNFLQKLNYTPSKNWAFDTQIIYTSTSNFDRYDRLQRKRDGQFRNAEWFYGPQKWLLGSQNVSYTGQTALADGIKISTAYQFFEESRNTRDFGDLILNTNKEQLDVISFNIDTEKNLHNLKINYGAEYVKNTVNSTAQTTNINTKEALNNIATRYPDDSTWESIGAYTSINWHLSTPFFLSAGLRYNKVLLNANFLKPELDFPFDNANNNFEAFTWSLGGSYEATRSLQLKANINTAFRAPNIDDVGKIFADSKPGILIIPNPSLKSEYAHNFSTSIDYSKNNFLFSFSSYYTLLNNALTEEESTLNGEQSTLFRGENSRIFSIQNSNKAVIYGFEFSGKIPLIKNLNLNGAYTITKGRKTLSNSQKVNVRHVPPNFGNIHLVYSNKKWGIDFFTEFNDGFEFDDLAPSEQLKTDIYATNANGDPFLPSWITINARGHYFIQKNIKITGAIENITDQRYRVYSSGISAPGLNFIGSLSFNF